jgi:putative RNA 2'-phosphotransferase
MPIDKTKASKFMSLILRHDPGAADIALDGRGWAVIDEMLAGMARKGYPITRQVLDEIVAEDGKQRYTISDDGLRIRANQGHSMAVDVELEELRPPAVLFHGTASRFADAIRRDGLKAMSRQHVHLSIDEPTAIIVGKRHGKPVVFRIDARRMADAGIKFLRSANNVWLVAAVPPEYLTELPGRTPNDVAARVTTPSSVSTPPAKGPIASGG